MLLLLWIYSSLEGWNQQKRKMTVDFLAIISTCVKMCYFNDCGKTQWCKERKKIYITYETQINEHPWRNLMVISVMTEGFIMCTLDMIGVLKLCCFSSRLKSVTQTINLNWGLYLKNVEPTLAKGSLKQSVASFGQSVTKRMVNCLIRNSTSSLTNLEVCLGSLNFISIHL